MLERVLHRFLFLRTVLFLRRLSSSHRIGAYEVQAGGSHPCVLFCLLDCYLASLRFEHAG
jgi:hypothetical protein